MIKNIDEVLQLYLFYELGEPDSSKLDFSFGTPTKDWSSSIEQDYISIYLLDIDENRQLRRNEWQREYEADGIKSSKPPAMLDLYYLIMAFDKDKDSAREHELMSEILRAVYRFSSIEKGGYGLTPELQKLLEVITIDVYPKGYLDDRLGLQLWSAIDQNARPFTLLKVTAPLELGIERSGPPVKTKDISYEPLKERLYAISGRVIFEEGGAQMPIASASVTLKKGSRTLQSVKTDAMGRFALMRIVPESLVLEASADGYQTATLPLEDIQEAAEKPLSVKLEK